MAFQEVRYAITGVCMHHDMHITDGGTSLLTALHAHSLALKTRCKWNQLDDKSCTCYFDPVVFHDQNQDLSSRGCHQC